MWCGITNKASICRKCAVLAIVCQFRRYVQTLAILREPTDYELPFWKCFLKNIGRLDHSAFHVSLLYIIIVHKYVKNFGRLADIWNNVWQVNNSSIHFCGCVRSIYIMYTFSIAPSQHWKECSDWSIVSVRPPPTPPSLPPSLPPSPVCMCVSVCMCVCVCECV